MATVAARLSPAEYLAFERRSEARHEYVDCMIRPRPPSNARHNRFTVALVTQLMKALDGRAFDVMGVGMRVRIPDGPYYYPDAVVAPSPPDLEDAEQDTLLNPLLVAEVLSPTTEAIDRGEKLDNYRLIPSLTDYLIVAQNRMRIDHYTHLSPTEWRLVTHTADAAIPLPTLGCELKLSDIYSRWQQEQTP